jgi:probable HAF family extracellular repeat protein
MSRRTAALPLRGPRVALDPLESRRLMSAYAVVDLGTLGGSLSWAYDLNNNDQVVGYANDADGNDRAFLFTDANGNGVADTGEMVNLGVLAGDGASYAYGVNELGQVVGTSRTVPLGADGDERAVRFNPGAAPANLGVGTGSNGYGSGASDISDSAQVVGGVLSGNNYVPYVRSAAGTVSTFTLPAPYNLWGEARAINDAGFVVGYSGSTLGDSGFLRSPTGTLTPVGHENPAQPYNYAWDVNDAGQVVGEGFNSAGDYHGFIWQNGAATDLGTLPGMGSSEAYGVNNSGAAVGRVEPPDGVQASTRAFLYRDGAMVDLNDLIPATSGYFVADARAINDRGAIAAEAFTPTGAIHAVLLVPSASATGRVFYNNSAFDGHDPAANAADDAAVAPDKVALAGSAAPTFANVTGYSRGINGIMIDVDGATGTPTRDDFDFRVGNGGTPANWAAAPEPRSLTVRPGAGVNGSDRVTVTWADGAIRNAWLRVSVLPGARTGLWSPAVFSFGNLVGETGGPATGAPAFVVGGSDVLTTRARLAPAPAPITEVADFDRDGRAGARDLAVVRWGYGASLSAAPQQPPPAAALSGILTGRLRPTRRSPLADLP